MWIKILIFLYRFLNKLGILIWRGIKFIAFNGMDCLMREWMECEEREKERKIKWMKFKIRFNKELERQSFKAGN